MEEAHNQAFTAAMKFLNEVDASLAPDMKQDYACEMFTIAAERRAAYVQQSKVR